MRKPLQTIDLFGNEIAEPVISTATGKPKRKEEPKGYAGRPGTGPDGQTCKTCLHAVKVKGGSKAYWKCEIIRHRWTGSYGTDIRLKSPSCSLFQPKTDFQPF